MLGPIRVIRLENQIENNMENEMETILQRARWLRSSMYALAFEYWGCFPGAELREKWARRVPSTVEMGICK